MDDATRAAIQKLRYAEKQGLTDQARQVLRETESRVFTQEAIAAIRKTNTPDFSRQAVNALRKTETQGLVQQALSQMRSNDWRKTVLKGTAQEQYQALMLGAVGQQSVQSAFQQLRDEFNRSGSEQAKSALASLSASSADLAEMLDLPGVVSSSQYVQSLANQTGQISAAVANTDWGRALAEQFSREGLTDSFIDDLIDYTTDELENDALAEEAWELAENVPDVRDDDAEAFVRLLLPIIKEVALQSPTRSAASMLVFGTIIFGIVSDNPEAGKLTALAAATQLFANFMVVTYEKFQEQMGTKNHEAD